MENQRLKHKYADHPLTKLIVPELNLTDFDRQLTSGISEIRSPITLKTDNYSPERQLSPGKLSQTPMNGDQRWLEQIDRLKKAHELEMSWEIGRAHV